MCAYLNSPFHSITWQQSTEGDLGFYYTHRCRLSVLFAWLYYVSFTTTVCLAICHIKHFCLNWFFVLMVKVSFIFIYISSMSRSPKPKVFVDVGYYFFYMLFEAFLFFSFFYIFTDILYINSCIHPATKWRKNEKTKKMTSKEIVYITVCACTPAFTANCYASKSITFIRLKMFDVVFISSSKTCNPQTNTHSFTHECHTYIYESSVLWTVNRSRQPDRQQCILYSVYYCILLYIGTFMRVCVHRAYFMRLCIVLCLMLIEHEERGKREKCLHIQTTEKSAVTLPLRLRLHFNTQVYH